MAHYHARANVCRAGVTYAGLAHLPFVATIGGTDRTASILYDAFTVTTALDGSPSTCAFSVQGFTPTQGHDVTLTLGGEMIWGGTLTDVRAQAQKFVSGAVYYQCQAIDWTWLMDRYSRVSLSLPADVAVNQAVTAVLSAFTDGGFRRGYVPMDLSAVGPMTFEGETVSGALRRIAASASAYMRVRPQKRVDVFDTLPASNALSLSNSSDIRGVVYESSLSQVRTRTYYVGGGGRATATTAPTSSTIPVDECGWYTGTQVYINGDVVAYTGRSVESGPGTLTGVTGISADIAEGATVSVLAQADDVTAQTALATVLGGGRSGVAVGWFSDGRLSQAELDARAAADVEAFKSAIPALSYVTTKRYHEPGKTVSASISDPLTISDTFRIQHVVMRPYGAVTGNAPTFEYAVTCRVFRRADLLDSVE